MKLKTYTTCLLNPLNGSSRQAITNDPFIMREFANQVSQERSAVTPGVCAGIFVSARNDFILPTDELRVFRSRVDPNCEVIATEIMMEHFKGVANEIMYRSFPTNQFVELFERVYRPNRRKTNGSVDMMQTWQLMSDKVVRDKLDYVKLSMDLPFFAKGMVRTGGSS